MRGVTARGSSDRPAVLFLHGGVINRHMWEPVIGRLQDDYHCIAIDLPAHGDLSDGDFTMAGAVERVPAVLDALDVGEAALVGLSLGGYVAQTVAATSPSRVSGLVLSGATIRYVGWDGMSAKLYGMVFPLVSRPAARALSRKLTEDLGADLASRIMGGGLSMRGGAQALRRLPGTDYGSLLEGFIGPMVIANGERDTPNREAEAVFLHRFPEASVITIEDAGHACALTQPEAFAAAVDYLMARVT